jgi:hypothetical protein
MSLLELLAAKVFEKKDELLAGLAAVGVTTADGLKAYDCKRLLADPPPASTVTALLAAIAAKGAPHDAVKDDPPWRTALGNVLIHSLAPAPQPGNATAETSAADAFALGRYKGLESSIMTSIRSIDRGLLAWAHVLWAQASTRS